MSPPSILETPTTVFSPGFHLDQVLFLFFDVLRPEFELEFGILPQGDSGIFLVDDPDIGGFQKA